MNRLILVITAGALALGTSFAQAQCGGDTCSVGALGTGGEMSGGSAQGFRFEVPSTRFPGSTVSNVGNNDSGRLNISGQGTASGTFRKGIQRGHATGIIGDWSGLCDAVDPSEC